MSSTLRPETIPAIDGQRPVAGVISADGALAEQRSAPAPRPSGVVRCDIVTRPSSSSARRSEPSPGWSVSSDLTGTSGANAWTTAG